MCEKICSSFDTPIPMGFLMKQAESFLALMNSQPALFARVCLRVKRSCCEPHENIAITEKMSKPKSTFANFPSIADDLPHRALSRCFQIPIVAT